MQKLWAGTLTLSTNATSLRPGLFTMRLTEALPRKNGMPCRVAQPHSFVSLRLLDLGFLMLEDFISEEDERESIVMWRLVPGGDGSGELLGRGRANLPHGDRGEVLPAAFLPLWRPVRM